MSEPSSASLHSAVLSSDSGKNRRAGKMRQLQVVPARSLGPFRLGATVHSLVAMLQGEVPGFLASSVGVGTLPDGSTRIYLDDDNIALTFDARTQRLAMIEVCNLGSIELSHKEGMRCGKGATPTFVRLYDVLGPTFAGQMDTATGEYVLSYPGLDVVFRVPAEFRDRYVDGDHPITFPDGTTPVALGLIVREDKQHALCAPLCEPFAQQWATVRVRWGRGIDFVPSEPRASEHRPCRIDFGCSPQDLMSSLGPPESITPKGDERLMIHNSDGRDSAGPQPLYAFGYASYGIDFVFSSTDDTLAKISLHTSAPGHEAYLRYARCFFEIPLIPEVTAEQWLGMSSAAVDTDAPTTSVTPFTKFAKVSEWLKSADAGLMPRPLLATAAEGTLGLWAMNGIVFTIIQSTDDIAVVTLTRSAPAGLRRAEAKTESPPPILAFRTPVTSGKPSPEAGPAAPPLKRVPLSADFDDCNEIDRAASRDPIDSFFAHDTVADTAGGVANGAAAARGREAIGSMPAPSVLREPVKEGPDESTSFHFNYPGFTSAGGGIPPLPPPLETAWRQQQSSAAGTEREASSGVMPERAATRTWNSDDLTSAMESSPQRNQGGRTYHDETDYADDGFESLQPTEEQLARDAPTADPSAEHHDEPDTAAEEQADAAAAEEELAPAATANTYSVEDELGAQEPAERPEAVDGASPAGDPQSNEGAESSPLPSPDADEALASSRSPVTPAAAATDSAPRTTFSYAAMARKHADPEVSRSPPHQGQVSPPAGESEDASGTSRGVSPGFADDEVTPPVTPDMNGQSPPGAGPKKTVGATVASHGKGKKKKGKR